MKRFSYSKNTLFLILAGLLSQVLGAVLRILLSYRLKEEGMAFYQVAVCVYSLFLTPVLCGIPISLTKFISKRVNSEKEFEINIGIQFAFKSMCLLGIICSLLMFFSSRFFAYSLKAPAAEYAIFALSPAVFAVALGAVSKSCFEGFSNMLPCAVSQGIESVLKLVFAYFFTSFFGIFSLKYASFGATLSITCGEAVATFVLFLFMPSKAKAVYSTAKKRKIAAEIISYALPVTAYAVILSSLNLLENSVVRNSLLSVKFSPCSAQKSLFRYLPFTSVFDSVKESGRLSAKGADWLYGAYFGYTLTIIRFPAGLLRTFCVPFFPFAANCFAHKNTEKLADSVYRLIKTMLLISLPLCAFFIGFAPQITSLIFASSAYSQMLALASPLLVIAPLCELFSTLWYACGKTFPPFIFSLITSFLSIVLSAILIRIPQLNILGAAVAAVFSVLFELVMYLFFTNRYLKIRPSAFLSTKIKAPAR